MKCKYCGSNLGIEDKTCPYCGKVNVKAAGYQAKIEWHQDSYEQVESEVKEKSKLAGRIGRILVIAAMLAITFIMLRSIDVNSNVEKRYERQKNEIAKEVEKNRDEITEAVDSMVKNRNYQALYFYQYKYNLRSDSSFDEYKNVFGAVARYHEIQDDILNIIDGYDQRGEKAPKDWCREAAISIDDWSWSAEGNSGNNAQGSSENLAEHEAFLSDIKKETQDMVQVYFNLTDEEAASIWKMDRDDLTELLYGKCEVLYLEEDQDE